MVFYQKVSENYRDKSVLKRVFSDLLIRRMLLYALSCKINNWLRRFMNPCGHVNYASLRIRTWLHGSMDEWFMAHYVLISDLKFML